MEKKTREIKFRISEGEEISLKKFVGVEGNISDFIRESIFEKIQSNDDPAKRIISELNKRIRKIDDEIISLQIDRETLVHQIEKQRDKIKGEKE